MSGYAQKRLQGRDRLHRVHRVRTLAFGALAAVTALLVVVDLVVAGGSLKPLFLPMDGALELALIMGLIGTVLSGFFRHLEVKHVATDSQRFLLAKAAMARFGAIGAVALVVGALLLLPMAALVTGDLMTEPPRALAIPAGGSRAVNFTAPDGLGLSYVRTIVVSGQPANAGQVLVTVSRDNASLATAWVNYTDRIVLPFDASLARAPAGWSVVLENRAFSQADLALVVQKAPMPGLFGAVPLLLVLVGVANVGWWFIVRPARERTRHAAVYAGGVETRLGDDERAYAEYAVSMPRDAPPVEAPAPRPARPAARAPAPVLAKAPELPKPSRPVKSPIRAPKPKAETAKSLAAKGDVLLDSRQPEAALAAYDEALRLSPSWKPALLGRATCIDRLGRRSDAREAYRQVLAVDPLDETTLSRLTALLIDERRWREALELVDGILRRRPHDRKALEQRGDILTNLGRRTEALGSYDAAFALDSTDEGLRQKIEEVRVDVPGLLSRALIASASGNYEQALRLFDEILEVEPGSVNALIGKSVAYRRSGKSREALNCLDLVLSLQPTNVAALLNRGHILEAEGDLDGALDAFDKLVSLSSLDDEAWAAQGDVLAKMGRDDDALRAYAEALKLNPADDVIQAKVRELDEVRTADADILQELYEVKGVGPARAKALLNAGFRSAEDFALATVDELSAVRGVTRKVAEDLIAHFSEAIAPEAR